MPKNRFLQLERAICRGLTQTKSGSISPEKQPWIGTGERLIYPEDQPRHPTKVGTTGALSAEWNWAVQSWDDGLPIELRYDSEILCSSDGRLPVALTSLKNPSESQTVPSLLNLPDKVMVSAAPLTEAASNELNSDEDFAAQVRALLSNASSITAARPDALTLGEPPPAAPPKNSPTPPAETSDNKELDTITRYQVFDQLQENLYPARAFDMGTVSVESAFDAIEKAIDREERGPARTKPSIIPPPLPLDRMDIVEDLSLMMAGIERTPPRHIMSTSTTWRDFTPITTNTLVIDGVEFPPPNGVMWKNWSTPGINQFRGKSQQITRAKSDVIQIVLHETVNSTWQGVSGADLGVQFHLDRDGTMVQHNDAVDLLWHVRTFAEKSIGIEVVNSVFDNDDIPELNETVPGARIKVPWSAGHGGFYVIPSQNQMESLARSTQELIRQFAIPNRWLQVIPHPDPTKASGSMAGKWFFMMGTGGHLYFTNMKNEPGIASHSVLRDHNDGAFPALFTWLRLYKGMTSDNAYQLAIQIAEDAGGLRYQTHFDSKTGAMLQLLDITDVI